MNLFAVAGVLLLLVAVLTLLGLWQKMIAEHEKRRVIADLHDAQARGTDQAMAQHPQIDVQACIGCGSCVAACPEEGVLELVDGVAQVIHGSRCIGHSLCAEACPVGAVKIGLGDMSLRPDIPVLTPTLETSRPGIYIAGELGGLALIRNAVEQGTQAVVDIARRVHSEPRPHVERDLLDVLIVGAGPAGLAAMLEAKRRGLRYAAIDQQDVGGTVRKYPRRKLTLTGPLELPLYGPLPKTEFLKEELIELWEEIVESFQLELHSDLRLTGAERHADVWVARTDEGIIPTRHLLLALGRRGAPRKLGVPGEESEKVLYQLIDAATYTEQHVLVVGGGDSAIEAATALADQAGNVVTLSYRRDGFFRLKPRNEQRISQYARLGKVKVIFESEVTRVEADAVDLSCAEEGVRRTTHLRNDYVFTLIGGEPPYAFLRKLGIRFGGDPEEMLVEEDGRLVLA